jgi:hypothetical protein
LDWISLIGPAIVAAGVSGAISVVGLIVATRAVRRLHADKLEFDFALAAHKFNLDKALGEIRAAADPSLAEMKFKYDRDLSELKRTTELAERAVAQFYQVRDVIDAVRSTNRSDGGPPKETEENPELLVLGRIDDMVDEINHICRPARHGIMQ